MLFRKQTTKVRSIQNMNPIIFLPVFIAIMITISSCTATNGSIVILENMNKTGFTFDFKEWSARNKCELFLNKDDVIQIEVACENGEINLTVSGKNGSEPYTGKDLRPGIFTITISETDNYVFKIVGSNATGHIKVKNLSLKPGS